MRTMGKHFLLDLKECNKDHLDDLEFIKDVLHTVTKDAGNAVIGESFHRFLPQGISGVVLITGAHLCIHTWPEYGYSAIDVFTYGDLFQPEEAAKLIMEKLESKNPSIVELKRGF
ncbi:MAG: adenosylmethionine decarboxylase [Chloroflexi bacterium]|nr:adenosylmethionine decarboxylase [Chloroflexota bacterium]